MTTRARSMRFDQLLKGMACRRIGPAGNPLIRGVCYDSRRVRPGDLFVALTGRKADGHDFIPQVAAAGAVAVLAERPVESPAPAALVPSTLEALSPVSLRFYGHPSAGLCVVGVTGTNGKTTITYMLESIWKAAGRKSGVIGTVEYRWGKKTERATNTTPFSADIQRLLARMKTDGVTHVAMEVSSHALELHRVDGMEFRAGIFTNLTRDHLDFHQTMENYFEAKAKLFDRLLPTGKKRKFAIINADDAWAEKMLARVRCDRLTYGVRSPADLSAENVSLSAEGTSFDLAVAGRRVPVRLGSVGMHNVSNALAAAGAALSLGIPMSSVQKGLRSFRGAPGRLERVVLPSKKRGVSSALSFSVFVDYAHTDDALKNVLEALRPLASGRLITVFGCGGDRDRTKRPLMGDVAVRMSDYVIVTSDNPRSEEPQRIALDIEVGIRRTGLSHYEVVLDREQAIRKAVGLAKPGDVVLVAGKGHETYQIFKDRTVDFDDRVAVQQALSGRVGA